ncbi:DJ-1/PfpI family protein [Humidisolicoccus flavus]|uniref:DJ-1/PfpI family protein n=1 Tax=Humidisolicoccus flavus TaxID=3111414 RepID=UPI00324CD2DF
MAEHSPPAHRTLRIGIVVFDEVEVLDAFGPFEVFSVASRIANPESPEAFTVTLVQVDPDAAFVTARGGLQFRASCSILNAPEFDLILVTGGVTDQVEHNPQLLRWLDERINRSTGSTPLLASVCTGAFILANAGVVADGTVTTHWEDAEELARRFPALTVVTDVRWVRQGGVFTSAGISAGIDLSLHLVEQLISRERALATARQMDYDWRGNEGTLERER